MMRIGDFTCLLPLLLGVPGAGAAESDEAALTRLRVEIHQLVGSARCRNLVHCRLLALGVSPCGGPSEYVAYSSGFTDIPALETKASEFAFIQGEMVDRQDPPKQCVSAIQPQAQCIDHHCRVVPGK